MPTVNKNNVAFIEQVFRQADVKNPEVSRDFPNYNYRLRSSVLTQFIPYISEAPRLSHESDEVYNSRVLTSGRYFGEEGQEIILDDIVHWDGDIEGQTIPYVDRGGMAKTMLYLERCVLEPDKKNYTVTSVNLNNLDYVETLPPTVQWNVDLSRNKGYMVYRKTSTVNKSNDADGSLSEVISGWYPVSGFSNDDAKALIGDDNVVGFVDSNYHLDNNYGLESTNCTYSETPDNNIHYTGYESFQNELYTAYKIIDSGALNSPPSQESELTRDRTVDLKVDPGRSYSLERRVTRRSHNNTSNPTEWENISPNASFPYVDDENLSDYIDTNVNFQVSGVYDTLETTGDHSNSKDYFQVDFVEDWGKSHEKTLVTNREKSDELTFRSGENIKVIQRSTRKETTRGVYDQYASVDVHFNPYTTGVSGFVTGAENEKNFYQLEYQLLPKTSSNKKLHYERVTSAVGLAVGDEVFYNTGQEDGEYQPFKTNIFGESPSIIEAEKSTLNKTEKKFDESYIGASQVISASGIISPEIVPDSLGSGLGYSYFASGEKYLVVPKGGYSTLSSDSSLEFDSAGENRKAFFQGEQSDDVEASYSLTEYRSFDIDNFTSEEFTYNQEREVRISEKALCLGDSASDLPEEFRADLANKLLDRDHKTYPTFRNGTILNIDNSDGSVKLSNLKNNRHEFQERSNLFFEKNYTASLTILATGQAQSIEPLKQFITGDKIYYLERDVYIDSDVRTQANTYSPPESSDGVDLSLSPFSIRPNTRNPKAFGDEKVYLTQVHHVTKDSEQEFPFNDFDYYNYQPTISEEYTYINHSSSIIDNFSVKNTTHEVAYKPNDFTSNITAGVGAGANEGFSVLINTGIHETQSITKTNYDSDEGSIDVEFTPFDRGSYHEVQARADSTKDWATVSPAIEITKAGNKTEKVSPVSSSSDEIRIVEWMPSVVFNNYEGVAVPNESADSLILKSAASNRFYDLSKTEHPVTVNGTVTTAQANWAGTNDIYETVFNGDNANYLSMPSHRSFDIQKGEFSLEFWIKNAVDGADNIIVERAGVIKLSYVHPSKLTVELAGKTVIDEFDIGSTSSWKHIAIAKVKAASRLRDSRFRLYLYVDGEAQILEKTKNSDGSTKEEIEYKDCNYSDYSVSSNESFIVGRGLAAKLYQPRFYVGKSVYRGSSFTASKTDFSRDSNSRRYKILKFNYKRERSSRYDWIINRNDFVNVGPPSNYLPNGSEDAAPLHTYEWLNSIGSDEASPTNRALSTYMNSYAYRAPNNPHINKNYEGTPISRNSSGQIEALRDIKLDNYFFNVRNEDPEDDIANINRRISKYTKGKAPYLYEFLGKNPMYSLRFSKKGGEDARLIAPRSEETTSFSSGSRLRITKYVYKLYTKHAVVVGDIGHKSSRSSQGGWDYQLQYSTDSGSTWVDVDALSHYEDNLIFQNQEDAASPNSFDNIDHVNVLPTVIMKSDITEKYRPDQIEFRIEKRQNISIDRRSSDAEVVKKVNFLPIEVDIPTSGTLLDLTQKTFNDADSAQDHHQAIYDTTNQVSVSLDSAQKYVVFKNPNEKILLSSDTKDTLQVESVSMDTNFPSVGTSIPEVQMGSTDRSFFPSSSSSYSELEDEKAYEIAGLTGLRVYGAGVTSLETVKSVIGLKPSGLVLNRVEKSFGEIKTGESIDLNPSETKLLFTPSITGSHLDELEDFRIYTENDSVVSEYLTQFTCSSFVTGSIGAGSDNVSIETGVSGVSSEPVYKFLNSPIMTGEFNVTADDDGKTFLCSGLYSSGIFVGNDYAFDVVNISSSAIKLFNSAGLDNSSPTFTLAAEKAKTITVKNSAENSRLISEASSFTSDSNASDVISILPDIEVEDSVDESLVIVDDIDLLNISNSKVDSSCIAINISDESCHIYDGTADGASLGSLSGISFNSSASRVNEIDSGVLLINHDEIVLTSDDANITGVIDTDSTLVLPSGFAHEEHVTFLNASQHEIKVISESGYKIDSKAVDYIPKHSSRKFTCSKSESGGKTLRNWSTSNIDVVKYNQLEVTSSNDQEVFIHNEDVDVKVASGGTSVGFSFNVVRSQINDIDFDSLRSSVTPIMRIFIDGYLEHTLPPGVLGAKVEKKSHGWVFKNINVISQTEVIIDASFHGRVYSYSGHLEEVSFKFRNTNYPSNFEFFVSSGKPRADLKVKLSSQDDAFKFGDEEDSRYSEVSFDSLSSKDLIRIGKSTKILGQETGGSNRFFVELQGGDSEHKNANKYKFDQPGDSKERVIINRNEDFSIELPTLTSSFNYQRGFALTFINASESASTVMYPSVAVSEEGDITVSQKEEAASFSANLYEYSDNLTEGDSKYLDFEGSVVGSSSSPVLNNGDCLISDGSLDEVTLRSFFGEDLGPNKFKETVSNHMASRISLNSSNKFNLVNHGFVTNHKVSFLCDRLTLVDYYYETSDWDSDYSSFNGTVGSHSMAEGDTLLLYDTGSDKYFLYTDYGSDSGDRDLRETSFSIPDSLSASFEGDGEASFQYNQTGPRDANKMFIRIGTGSNKEAQGVTSGSIYDLYSDSLSTATKKVTSNSIPFTLGFSQSDDTDEANLKTQSLFIKVVNENEFYLYSDRSLSSQVTYSSASDYTFLSERFHTEGLSYGKVSIVNLGEKGHIKTYSDDSIIAGTLDNEESVELCHASNNVYTSGDLVSSGVYFMTGWNGESDAEDQLDTLDINNCQSKQIVTSGAFHAKGALTSDGDFDNSYFINAGLNEVVITNTDDSTLDKLSKNRAYKHSSNGSFVLQDQSTANRDVIFYPKNEIHIPDRKNLGINKAKSQLDYNFVIYNPEHYNNQLEIVLPDSFSNLSKVAIVNKHNRSINVVNFSRTDSVTANAHSVLFIDGIGSGSFSLNSSTPRVSLYNTYKEEEDWDALPQAYFSVSHLGNLYKIYSEDDFSTKATVKSGSSEETYFVSNEGDIALDYDTHHGKKIIVERSPNFLRPYLYKADGSNGYLHTVRGVEIFRPVSNSAYFNFNVVSVSTSSVDIKIDGETPENRTDAEAEPNPGVLDYDGYRDGKMHSLINYVVEVDNFDYSEEGVWYFRHISPIKDQQLNISHSETSLASSQDYHIFGKELSLSLNVYYDKITTSDAEEINMGGVSDYELADGDIDLSTNNKYFKIAGIGGSNVSNLNIINTVYENIKVKSVTSVDAGSSDLTSAQKLSLAEEVLSYFTETEETAQTPYYLLDLGDAPDNITTTYERKVPVNYLNKQKILRLVLPEIVQGGDAGLEPVSFAFSGDSIKTLVEDFNPSYINFDRSSNVKYLKRRTVSLDLNTAFSSVFRHVFSDPQDVLLPSRGDMDAGELTDIYFTVVNASRNSSTLSCPEGSSVFGNLTISAGAAKKIKYSGGSFQDVTSDASLGVEVTSLSRAIFSSSSGVFVASAQNSASSALGIHKDVGSIKIINNTRAAFHVKNYNAAKTIVGSSTYSIPAYTYCDFVLDSSENFIIENLNKDVLLETLKDGLVEISASVYENKVVLFDAHTVSAFNIVDDSYFTTTFVPLVRIKEFGGSAITRSYDLARGASYNADYCLFNKYADRVDISHINPMKFNSNKTKTLKGVSCHMFEFILDQSIKDKILLTTKYYDYVFNHSQKTEFCLYNKDESEINLRKLDSKNVKFKDDDLLTGSTKCKLMLSCTQNGSGNPSVSELQSYTELLRSDVYSVVYKNFYLNKSFYDNKILIFKDPFDVIFPSDKKNTIIGNLSSHSCYTFLNKINSESYSALGNGSLPPNRSVRAMSGDQELDSLEILTPKNLVNKDDHIDLTNGKIIVTREPADIKFTGVVNSLKVVNASNKTINITAEGVTNKLYSSEKLDYTDKNKTSYSLCPRFNRRDWFVKLKGVDIPHLKAEDYYNEKEEKAGWLLQNKDVNSSYYGARYKFSNIFRTNFFMPAAGVSGYESISLFDNPYKFGLTLYGDKQGNTKKIFYDTDSSGYILNGLKLSWDMPSRVIAYALSTGHERLCYCKELNERTEMITLSGIEGGKYYILDDFDETYFDFVHSTGEEARSIKFQPTIEYDGNSYKPGEKFVGVSGKKDYQVHSNYFATVRASLFSAGGLDESSGDIGEIIKNDILELNREISEKKDTASSGVVTPTWNEVSEDYQKENFLNGKIEAITPDESTRELIQGKKLKDIEGTFEKDYFEFKISKDAGSDITYSTSNLIDPKELGSPPAGSDTILMNRGEVEAGEALEFILRVNFEDNNIDSPGYEYEIQSTFTYTNGTGKTIISVSLQDKDSMPFFADGTISSLNLDFTKVDTQEYQTKQVSTNTYDSNITKILNLRDNDAKLSLKNQQGYSFIPFGYYADYLYGLSFNITKSKASYRGIRFRLKKLTERMFTFENLRKDDKIGDYLTNNSETSALRYYLDTEVSSLAFHDIVRPGGVLRMADPGWKEVGTLSGGKMQIEGPVSNGDAIVFKDSNGSIIGGKPYFVRVTVQDATGTGLTNTITLLKIYSSDETLDSINKIDGDLQTTNRYKIVNYFDLSTENDGTHRAISSAFSKVYAEDPEEKEAREETEEAMEAMEAPVAQFRAGVPDPLTESDRVPTYNYDEYGEEVIKEEGEDKESVEDVEKGLFLPVTTLRYPVVIGSRTFYLECPKTVLGNERKDSWSGLFVRDGDRIRVNLELSAISKHWHGESNSGADFGTIAKASELGKDTLEPKYITSPDTHWVDENIFSSYKNLLYRHNAQVERVSYSKTGITLSIKLNTKLSYRYIYKTNAEIKSVTLNGEELTANSSGIVYNEVEDLKVVLNILNDHDYQASKKVDIFEDAIRKRVYDSLCIVEDSAYITDDPTEDASSPMASSYFDYQIPSLNGDTDLLFKQVYPSHYTEHINGLLSYNQKGENLTIYPYKDGTVPKPIGDGDFAAGLFYDMGMPASCKYIYPEVNAKMNRLNFTIFNYWKGFAHLFGGPDELYRTKPTHIRYNLESSNDGVSWSTVATGLVHKGDKFSIEREGLSDVKKYRMLVTGVDISHKDTTLDLWTASTKTITGGLRVPFKWTSTIFDSDLSGDGVLNPNTGLWEHSLDMIENYKIKKSVSFPEEGLTKFGQFDFIGEGGMPVSRLYMLNLDHNVRASYKDPINRGGISKVIITNKGENYRTAPTVSIAEPDKKGDDFAAAEARAIIEDGKLKHIEVFNAGSGYADLNENKKFRVEQFRADSIPYVFYSLKIAQRSSNKERGLPDIPITTALGLKLYKATLTPNESSLPKEEMEEFGLTYQDTEAIAEYMEEDTTGMAKSNSGGSANFMKGSSEDDEQWGDIQVQADRIQAIGSFATSAIADSKEVGGYQTYLKDEVDEVKGTESKDVDGLYQEDETDASSISHTYSTVKFTPGSDIEFIEYVTHPEVTDGKSWAVANNSSIADYRIIDNEIASKTTPWISSFSREDNPSLPKSFGVLPTSAVTSEVFNTYARAINYLDRIRVEAPIYAKIRRYRQIEYRYISDPVMAGLTFVNSEKAYDNQPPSATDASNERELEYLTYENKSRVNWIAYLDPDTNEKKVAHFSAFEAGLGQLKNGEDVNKENIADFVGDSYDMSPIWDEVDSKLKDTEEGKKFKQQLATDNPNRNPVSVGFPSTVNIPGKLGVFCNPAIYNSKGEGIPLPQPINPRAYAYGGELVYTSEIYDVSGEQSPMELGSDGSSSFALAVGNWDPVEGGVLVDIRGSDYIKAGYQNQIIFGCQTKGKPFFSAFLRTVKVWTEYEVVSSPEFTKNLPVGIREKYRPEESLLRCSLIEERSTCSESKIGEVTGKMRHSLCEGGRKASYNHKHSYEEVFGLNTGDDVIGPEETSTEAASSVQVKAKGVLKVEPEFDLAMAVYGSNEFMTMIRPVRNSKTGPCVQYCVPGQVKTLRVSEDPLVFNLKK